MRPGAIAGRGLSRPGNGQLALSSFSETDTTEDLKRFDVPTLIVHGDDDQVVPIPLWALRSAKLVKDATLKVYPGAPHGLAMLPAWKDEFNTDLLQFLKS